MIIKSISHKNTSFSKMSRLVHYVMDDRKMQDHYFQREPLIVKQHLRGYSKLELAEQFKQNDLKRNFNNKNRVVLRHEIVSFSELDNKNLTRDKLKRIAKEYLKRRSPKSKGLAIVHYDSNPHIHFIVSAVTIDHKSTRISQRDFSIFKQQMELFQQREFPELVSKISHEKKKVPTLRLSRGEEQMNLKGIKSDKQILSEKISKLAKQSKNLTELQKLLESNGIRCYQRRDTLSGIYFGKRTLRLTTLGVSKVLFRKLTLEEKRLRELKRNQGRGGLKLNR